MNSKYKSKELLTYALRRAKGIPIRVNLKKYSDFAQRVESFSFSSLTEAEISKKMNKLKSFGSSQQTEAEAFGLISEVVYRRLGYKPYPEQVTAGKLLLEEKVVQMQTGEGKTLSAVFTSCFQAIQGRRVHILTANEYLAGRDRNWMEGIYSLFGISVSNISDSMSPSVKRRNYSADVVYLTAKQAGFDYLRDCLSTGDAPLIQDFDVCIVDEADFIMIDEARTPLVIARKRDENYVDSVKADEIAASLVAEIDYIIDRRGRKCVLNLQGIVKVCNRLGIDDSSINGRIVISGINAALHARNLLNRDVDYIVKNDEILLIDSHTGRKAEKREWPYGIQRALESKEGVSLKSDGEICGLITIQNFISLYRSVSAMTATAVPAAAEFFNVYGLETCLIPPHLPDIRLDLPDIVFRSREDKYVRMISIVEEAAARHQPVLIGTASVAESFEVSKRLELASIPHQVLNAKQDEREAEMIARAGGADEVTVATNMAGRGTDILLGGPDGRSAETVRKAGGLYVLGLNRNESLRVDNQLRGRSGRQGDPGYSRFLMSLEDELFVKYGIEEFLPESVLEVEGGDAIDNPGAAKEISRAQEIIEGQHQVMRRTLNNYSAVIEKYRRRLIGLKNDAIRDRMFPLELIKLSSCSDEDVLAECFISELDSFWSHLLAFSNYLKEGIHLRRFGKRDPLFEFIDEVNTAYEEGLYEVMHNTIEKAGDLKKVGDIMKDRKRSGSAWTYQIDDNPFPSFSLSLIGMDSAVSAAVGPFLVLFAPVFLIIKITERLKKRLNIKFF